MVPIYAVNAVRKNYKFLHIVESMHVIECLMNFLFV